MTGLHGPCQGLLWASPALFLSTITLFRGSRKLFRRPPEARHLSPCARAYLAADFAGEVTAMSLKI
jgi:hypothetical protein